MEMGFNLRQELKIYCDVCGGWIDDHVAPCPVEGARNLTATKKVFSCPSCHKQKVELNRDDVFECRGCKALWCSGLGFGDPPQGARFGMIICNDETLDVYQLEGEGQGKFVSDFTLGLLAEMAREMRAARRARDVASDDAV